MDSRLNNCAFIKTILMLFVVLGHSVAFWTKDWFTGDPIFKSTQLAFLHMWVNSFHIYAFTLVSGYIFAYKIAGGGYRDAAKFVYNKIRRLIIPYIFSAFLWVIPISLLFLDWDTWYLFVHFICCAAPSQLWFLWMLFDIFIIVYFMRHIFMWNIYMGIFTSLAFFVLGGVGANYLPNTFCIWTALQYIPFFYIGMVLKVNQQIYTYLRKVPWYMWIIGDVFLLIFCRLGKDIITINGILNTMVLFIFHAFGAIAAFFVLDGLADHIKWEKSKLFNELSQCSMPIYLLHQQLIYFVIVALNGKVNPGINVIVNFVVALLVSFLLSKLLLSWRVSKFLLGC